MTLLLEVQGLVNGDSVQESIRRSGGHHYLAIVFSARFQPRTIADIVETHNHNSPRVNEGCVCTVSHIVLFRFDPCSVRVRVRVRDWG